VASVLVFVLLTEDYGAAACVLPHATRLLPALKSSLLARDVIYTYATIPVSVCLSVTFVHCGLRVRWIPDTFACLDRWMSLLLRQRLIRIVGWDDAGISGGKGGYGKIGNCSDITYFTYFLSMDRKHVTALFI